MTDGNGQPNHLPTLVLTEAELVDLLKIDNQSPHDTVKRVIAAGLRPCRYMRENRFTLAEVVRWLDETTENYGQ